MKKSEVITRKILRNGDIICIPIKDIGFAYAKYINVDKTFDLTFSYAEYVKFYVGIYPQRITDISQLNREVLIPPITIVTYTVVKRLGWEIFYNEEIFEDDKIIPDTKKGWPPFIFHDDERLYEEWRFFKFSKNEPEKSKSSSIIYEKVKHLLLAGILNSHLIPVFLIIENNKFLGKPLEDGLGVLGDNETFMLARERLRPCYALLDKNMRDKAIE
jgi:hypothetical protein